jgi:hypothetical protein
MPSKRWFKSFIMRHNLSHRQPEQFVSRSSTDPNVLNNPDLTLDPQLIPGTSCGSHDASPRNASKNSSAN